MSVHSASSCRNIEDRRSQLPAVGTYRYRLREPLAENPFRVARGSTPSSNPILVARVGELRCSQWQERYGRFDRRPSRIEVEGRHAEAFWFCYEQDPASYVCKSSRCRSKLPQAAFQIHRTVSLCEEHVLKPRTRCKGQTTSSLPSGSFPLQESLGF